MPLAMGVGLVRGDFALDGYTQLPLPKKGAESPFSAHVYGWMDQDGIWHGGGP